MATTESKDPARERFATLQNEVLEWYGAETTERYVDLDQPAMRAHVLEAGEGDPVVFIHGGGNQGMLWAPLLARIQGEFGLYAPDRPGHGLSDEFIYGDVDLRQHATYFVCSTLDALDLERADVVASSAGAFFAFAAALTRPERFHRLVFVGYPFGIIEVPPVWASPPAVRRLQLVGGLPGFTGLMGLLQSRMEPADAREMFEAEFHTDVSNYPDEFFEAWVVSVRDLGTMESFFSFVDRALGLRGMSAGADLSDDVAELDVPSLFLWGENDLAPVETGRESVAPIPDGTFEVVEGAGHFPFQDAPDWTADRITRFLQADSGNRSDVGDDDADAARDSGEADDGPTEQGVSRR